MVVVPGLQNLPADEPVAVGTFYPELGLVVLLTVGEAVPGERVPGGVRMEGSGV